MRLALVSFSVTALVLGCQTPSAPEVPETTLRAADPPPEGPSSPSTKVPPENRPLFTEPVEPPPPPKDALPLLDRREFSGEVNWGVGADASGPGGVVTSVEDAATRAGVLVLEAGGNAIDAAVATALALAVTHPSAGNLGGGGFLLLKHDDRIEAIDFREDSPRHLRKDEFWKMIGAGGHGPHSVGVPGTVAGLYLAHQRHGRLPWAELVMPAERLAREGYVLGGRQAQTIFWAREALLQSAVAREAFFNGRVPKKAGTRIVRPRLALALERIRQQGAAGFYTGPTARDLVASVGGAVSLEDLESYEAKIRDPLFIDFGAHRVVTMPSPSGGGVALIQQLLMLQEVAIAETATSSAERIHLIAEASRRAQVERHLYVVAPEAQSAGEYAALRARALDPQTWLAQHPILPHEATNPAELDRAFSKLTGESEQTTHLGVVDREGNLASLTVTLSASFGSHVFTQETGIVLNNSVGSFSALGKNTPAPAQRTVSSMAPTLVFLGPHALVLGSPGGDTIPSTVLQVFLSLALDDESLKGAVAKPRVHQGFLERGLSTERFAPLPAPLVARLDQWGHRVHPARYAQGDANVAAFIDGVAYAVSDRREGGLARAAQLPVSSEDASAVGARIPADDLPPEPAAFEPPQRAIDKHETQ